MNVLLFDGQQDGRLRSMATADLGRVREHVLIPAGFIKLYGLRCGFLRPRAICSALMDVIDRRGGMEGASHICAFSSPSQGWFEAFLTGAEARPQCWGAVVSAERP